MVRGLLVSIRMHHWVKNLVVFAALVFAEQYTDPDKVGLAVVAFVAFCLASSSVYLVNDILDREHDRTHPAKSRRPIASGEVGPGTAAAAAAFLFLGATIISLTVGKATMIVLLAYVALNLAYSAFLKHIVIIDVMSIAAGFVLRAVAGGLAISVPISPWLLVCTTLLALFMGFGKRRHELALLSEQASTHRKSLENYSPPFLDQMISVVTASTVVAYAIYTLSPEVVQHFGTRWMSLTIPFVLYGIFRYLFLIFHKEEGGSPTKLLLTDPPLLICVILWLGTVILLIDLG